MERKWIDSRGTSYWVIYKKQDSHFVMKSSSNHAHWQDTFCESWEEIETALSVIGCIEDKNHMTSGQALKELENLIIPAGFITYRKGYVGTTRETEKVSPCSHEWETYIGFMKTETFCKKCEEIAKV